MATADIPGSPAHAGVASASDVSLFGAELASPTLVSGPLAALAALSQFPALAGVTPGYGRFNPCPWGPGLDFGLCDENDAVQKMTCVERSALTGIRFNAGRLRAAPH